MLLEYFNQLVCYMAAEESALFKVFEARFAALDATMAHLKSENDQLKKELAVYRAREEWKDKAIWGMIYRKLSGTQPVSLELVVGSVVSYLRQLEDLPTVGGATCGGVVWRRNAATSLAKISDGNLLDIISYLSKQDAVPLACCATVFARPQPSLPDGKAVVAYASMVRIKAVNISGANGVNAEDVNGTFVPTGVEYNGKELLRKTGKNRELWLRYVVHNERHKWMVSDSINMKKNDAFGYATSNEMGLDDPTLASGWKVVNERREYEPQVSVACVHVDAQIGADRSERGAE